MKDTLFLSSKMIISLIQRIGIENVFRGIRDEIKLDYLRWDKFSKSSRTANHSDVGVIELMPISDEETFCFKYVNGHPKNNLLNFPTIMAFSVLSNMKTGLPLLISESTILTGFRTAATSVLMAQKLARSNSQTMAIIGNGAQSEFQALAFYFLMGIKKFRLFDIDKDATFKLIKNLEKYPDIECTICESTADASITADIVTTITADKCNSVILDETMIFPGQHLNAVGGDCPGKTELSKNIILKSKIFVEYILQSQIEGEIQQLKEDEINVSEIWEVLSGIKPGRENDEEITLFDSVGFALEDYSALKYIYQKVLEYNIGEKLDLIPFAENPKNLFGVLL